MPKSFAVTVSANWYSFNSAVGLKHSLFAERSLLRIICAVQSRRPSCLLNKRTNGGTDVYFPPTNPNGSGNSLLVSIKAVAWRRANQLPPEPVYFPWWFTESRLCGAVALLCLLRRRLRLISHNKVHIWLATVPVVTVFFLTLWFVFTAVHRRQKTHAHTKKTALWQCLPWI